MLLYNCETPTNTISVRKYMYIKTQRMNFKGKLRKNLCNEYCANSENDQTHAQL